MISALVISGALLVTGWSVYVFASSPDQRELPWRLVAPVNPPKTARSTPPPDPTVELASVDTVLADIRHAKAITFSAYTLQPHSAVVKALESAADRGHKVTVALARGLRLDARRNAATEHELSAHGVRVRFAAAGSRRSQLAAAILDGQLFLTDRDWAQNAGDAIVIHDSLSDDRDVVARALGGRSDATYRLWTRKADALFGEGRMLGLGRSHHIRISSDAFGPATSVYKELMQRRSAGDDVSLLISRSEYQNSQPEQVAVSKLVDAGVNVRQSASHTKMAIDGATVWIGSANATTGFDDEPDFGLVVTSASLANRLAERFDRYWEQAIAI